MYFRELLELNPELSAVVDSIPADLDGQFVLHRYDAHTFIQQKGSNLTSIGILLSGSFRVVNELENGNVFMIEVNDAVSFIGEVTLLAGELHTSVSIETMTPCTVAYLPVRSFDRWLREDVSFLRFISEHVAKKLYVSSYHRGERNFYSAKYILLKYILDHVSSPRSGHPATLRRTRQQMSEEIGMSVNTINRNLQSFRQDQLISVHHGKVVLSDENRRLASKALQTFITQNRNGAKPS